MTCRDKRSQRVLCWASLTAIVVACSAKQIDEAPDVETPMVGSGGTAGEMGSAGAAQGGSAQAGAAQGQAGMQSMNTAGQVGQVGADGGPAEAVFDRPLSNDIIMACTDLVAAYCVRYQVCEPTGIISRYGDLSTCILVESTECNSWMRLQGVTADEQYVATVADVFAELGCSELIRGVRPQVQSPGTLSIGEGCVMSLQCESLYCGGDSSCQPPPPMVLQISCDSDPAVCPSDMLCVAGLCAPKHRGGEPCDQGAVFCAEGFSCANEVCVSAMGGPECLCEPGGASAGTGGIPVCTYCPFWTTCSGFPGITGNPTCVPKPLLGSACMDDSPLAQCPSALACVDGGCEVPVPPWEEQ